MRQATPVSPESLSGLREQVAGFYRNGAYRQAAQCLRRLEVLGDRSRGWWEYALMLAGALGEESIVETAARALESDRTALLRALKSAWHKAVSENHRELAKRISQRLWQLDPDDAHFRVLNLLDSLAAEDPLLTNLGELTAQPLPLKALSPELLMILIRALQRAGFDDDSGRMLDYLARKHPPETLEERARTAQLACDIKRPALALALTAGAADAKLRYLRSLACLQAMAWDELPLARLGSAELQAALDADPTWRPGMLFLALMMPGYTNADHLALARRAASGMQAGAPPPGHPRPQARPDRLRIGYLSGDFKKHPMSQLTCLMLEAHDRHRFEWCAFDNSRDDASPARQRILAAFDEVVAVRKLGTAALAQAIRDARIDVLVDLSGHTNDSRLDVLAHRPAPLQITWLGYPGTLGRGLADYMIGDFTAMPEAKDFDEALIRLPRSYMPCGEYPALVVPPDRSSQGLPEGLLVFACFNQQAKISEESFDDWCAMLRATPQSILWLSDESEVNRQTLMAAAAERGVAPGRLYWAQRVENAQHIQRIACADLVLDSHPYTMHTTAVDALSAGVPFLTYCGETVASRVSSSLLRTAGLGDCVCASRQEVVQRMVSLAADAPARVQLRARFFAARTASPLYDSLAFASLLETAYDRAYARWLEGRAPSVMNLEGGSTAASCESLD